MSKKRDEIQDEALEILKNCNRCSVAISMGVGKTFIGLKHLDEMSFTKALVVAPKRAIFKSWQDEAVKHNLEHLLDKITFSTYLSLSKQQLDYDVVYLDECHNLLDTHTAWLDSYAGNIIGLTGTPPKYASSTKGKIITKYCPIRYRYITDDAVEDGILNDYRIIVHMLELDKTPTYLVKTKNKQWMTSEIAHYNYLTMKLMHAASAGEEQFRRIARMRGLMSFTSKEKYAKLLLNEAKDKCIVFANTHDQADKICRHSYHSSNPDSDENLMKFKVGIITKLSAVLQLNEGVNIPELKQGIILHAYGNERKSSQRIGRLLRLNPEDVATVHILCYRDTVDEAWTREALSSFDSSKIQYLEV